MTLEMSLLTFNYHVRALCLAAVLVLTAAAGALASALVLRCAAGCPTTVPGHAAAPPRAPAVVTITPAPDARGVDPLGRVSVTATLGTLTDVSMVNDAGEFITGI